jgi:hypothetical protein
MALLLPRTEYNSKDTSVSPLAFAVIGSHPPWEVGCVKVAHEGSYIAIHLRQGASMRRIKRGSNTGHRSRIASYPVHKARIHTHHQRTSQRLHDARVHPCLTRSSYVCSRCSRS